jgi:hypothetical protein
MTGDLSIRRIFRNSFRVYFAPITGAIKGIRAEMRCADPKHPPAGPHQPHKSAPRS